MDVSLALTTKGKLTPGQQVAFKITITDNRSKKNFQLKSEAFDGDSEIKSYKKNGTIKAKLANEPTWEEKKISIWAEGSEEKPDALGITVLPLVEFAPGDDWLSPFFKEYCVDDEVTFTAKLSHPAGAAGDYGKLHIRGQDRGSFTFPESGDTATLSLTLATDDREGDRVSKKAAVTIVATDLALEGKAKSKKALIHKENSISLSPVKEKGPFKVGDTITIPVQLKFKPIRDGIAGRLQSDLFMDTTATDEDLKRGRVPIPYKAGEQDIEIKTSIRKAASDQEVAVDPTAATGFRMDEKKGKAFKIAVRSSRTAAFVGRPHLEGDPRVQEDFRPGDGLELEVRLSTAVTADPDENVAKVSCEAFASNKTATDDEVKNSRAYFVNVAKDEDKATVLCPIDPDFDAKKKKKVKVLLEKIGASTTLPDGAIEAEITLKPLPELSFLKKPVKGDKGGTYFDFRCGETRTLLVELSEPAPRKDTVFYVVSPLLSEQTDDIPIPGVTPKKRWVKGGVPKGQKTAEIEVLFQKTTTGEGKTVTLHGHAGCKASTKKRKNSFSGSVSDKTILFGLHAEPVKRIGRKYIDPADYDEPPLYFTGEELKLHLRRVVDKEEDQLEEWIGFVLSSPAFERDPLDSDKDRTYEISFPEKKFDAAPIEVRLAQGLSGVYPLKILPKAGVETHEYVPGSIELRIEVREAFLHFAPGQSGFENIYMDEAEITVHCTRPLPVDQPFLLGGDTLDLNEPSGDLVKEDDGSGSFYEDVGRVVLPAGDVSLVVKFVHNKWDDEAEFWLEAAETTPGFVLFKDPVDRKEKKLPTEVAGKVQPIKVAFASEEPEVKRTDILWGPGDDSSTYSFPVYAVDLVLRLNHPAPDEHWVQIHSDYFFEDIDNTAAGGGKNKGHHLIKFEVGDQEKRVLAELAVNPNQPEQTFEMVLKETAKCVTDDLHTIAPKVPHLPVITFPYPLGAEVSPHVDEDEVSTWCYPVVDFAKGDKALMAVQLRGVKPGLDPVKGRLESPAFNAPVEFTFETAEVESQGKEIEVTFDKAGDPSPNMAVTLHAGDEHCAVGTQSLKEINVFKERRVRIVSIEPQGPFVTEDEAELTLALEHGAPVGQAVAELKGPFEVMSSTQYYESTPIDIGFKEGSSEVALPVRFTTEDDASQKITVTGKKSCKAESGIETHPNEIEVLVRTPKLEASLELVENDDVLLPGRARLKALLDSPAPHGGSAVYLECDAFNEDKADGLVRFPKGQKEGYLFVFIKPDAAGTDITIKTAVETNETKASVKKTAERIEAPTDWEVTLTVENYPEIVFDGPASPAKTDVAPFKLDSDNTATLKIKPKAAPAEDITVRFRSHVFGSSEPSVVLPKDKTDPVEKEVLFQRGFAKVDGKVPATNILIIPPRGAWRADYEGDGTQDVHVEGALLSTQEDCPFSRRTEHKIELVYEELLDMPCNLHNLTITEMAGAKGGLKKYKRGLDKKKKQGIFAIVRDETQSAEPEQVLLYENEMPVIEMVAGPEGGDPHVPDGDKTPHRKVITFTLSDKDTSCRLKTFEDPFAPGSWLTHPIVKVRERVTASDVQDKALKRTYDWRDVPLEVREESGKTLYSFPVYQTNQLWMPRTRGLALGGYRRERKHRLRNFFQPMKATSFEQMAVREYEITVLGCGVPDVTGDPVDDGGSVDSLRACILVYPSDEFCLYYQYDPNLPRIRSGRPGLYLDPKKGDGETAIRSKKEIDQAREARQGQVNPESGMLEFVDQSKKGDPDPPPEPELALHPYDVEARWVGVHKARTRHEIEEALTIMENDPDRVREDSPGWFKKFQKPVTGWLSNKFHLELCRNGVTGPEYEAMLRSVKAMLYFFHLLSAGFSNLNMGYEETEDDDPFTAWSKNVNVDYGDKTPGHESGSYVPKLGWNFGLGLTLFEGTWIRYWGYKEHHDSQVFPWRFTHADMTLIGIDAEISFGFAASLYLIKFEAVIYGSITLSVKSKIPGREVLGPPHGKIRQAKRGSTTTESQQDADRREEQRGQETVGRPRTEAELALGAKVVLIHENVLSFGGAVKSGLAVEAGHSDRADVWEYKVFFLGITLSGTFKFLGFREREKEIVLNEGNEEIPKWWGAFPSGKAPVFWQIETDVERARMRADFQQKRIRERFCSFRSLQYNMMMDSKHSHAPYEHPQNVTSSTHAERIAPDLVPDYHDGKKKKELKPPEFTQYLKKKSYWEDKWLRCQEAFPWEDKKVRGRGSRRSYDLGKRLTAKLDQIEIHLENRLLAWFERIETWRKGEFATLEQALIDKRIAYEGLADEEEKKTLLTDFRKEVKQVTKNRDIRFSESLGKKPLTKFDSLLKDLSHYEMHREEW